jgi:hypothetical protein
MISCPACKNEELTGVIFCTKCGTQLIPGDESRVTSNIGSKTTDSFNIGSVPTFPSPPSDSPDSNVALLILSDGEVIHVAGKDEFTFGRSTEGQTIIPDIDLSPFQAYEAGVSRLHANIQTADAKITIKDLGSANGTRLNGNKIVPHEEYSLTHGDILTFGRLKVQVLLRL